MTGLADWLTLHLTVAGIVDQDRVSRRAKPQDCRRCRQTVLVGLDADRAALPTTVDPIPLSPLGEALALLDDRRTLALHRDMGRYVLDPRDNLQIQAAPAGSRLGEDVLRSHRCHSPPPAGPATSLSGFPQARAIPATAAPPF